MTRRITLPKINFEYLIHHFPENGIITKQVCYKGGKEYVVIEVNESYAERVHEWANEEIIRIGFDLNYEITDVGRILETIVDAFWT